MSLMPGIVLAAIGVIIMVIARLLSIPESRWIYMMGVIVLVVGIALLLLALLGVALGELVVLPPITAGLALG